MGAEALVNMTLETSPEPVSYNPDDLMEKCTVSGSPSCPMLRDALSQLTSEVRLARDQAADELNTVETDCKRLSEEYERQTQEWETQLEDNSAKLSEQTGVPNTAELDLSEKVTEANELLRQLSDFREGSVECGGGEMTLTREVVTPASNGGAEFPIMIDKQSCNMQPCPIDCVVGEWSDYGMCSDPCGDLSETQECNVFACDMPCELDPEWTEWSPCSKECDTGITVQTKGVM